MILRVVVAGAAHVLVLVGSSVSRGCVGRRSALDAAFEDAFDMATVRRALARYRERALTRSVHRCRAMLVSDADDAEHRSVAHLWLWVLGHGAARDLGDMRPKSPGPFGHTLWRPLAVIGVLSRAMLGIGDGCPCTRVAAAVRGDADIAVKAFDNAASGTHVDELSAQGKRHAVQPIVE